MPGAGTQGTGRMTGDLNSDAVTAARTNGGSGPGTAPPGIAVTGAAAAGVARAGTDATGRTGAGAPADGIADA